MAAGASCCISLTNPKAAFIAAFRKMPFRSTNTKDRPIIGKLAWVAASSIVGAIPCGRPRPFPCCSPRPISASARKKLSVKALVAALVGSSQYGGKNDCDLMNKVDILLGRECANESNLLQGAYKCHRHHM